jgi:3'(2'), 5'-bisphosphate nucleotidase
MDMPHLPPLQGQPAPADWLQRVANLALAAAREVLDVYERGPALIGFKADDSPVTEADSRAEDLICQGLRDLAPHLAIVAEEAAAAGRLPTTGQRLFWLVDPLDGTKEFLSRNDEFTVNIALIDDGAPVLGVVVAPALGLLWAGALGAAAYVQGPDGTRRAITTRNVPEQGLTVMGSRSHGDEASTLRLLQGQRVARFVAAGSSLKLCRIAEGAADLYARLGRTMEWDIAAGHAVLLAAGGGICTVAGDPLRYGKPGYENPHFVAYGRPWAPSDVRAGS